MAYSLGVGGNLLVGTGSPAVFCVKNWSTNLDRDPQDVTTTCSQGWRDRIAGVKSLELTFTAFYDQADGGLVLFNTDDHIHVVAQLGSTLSKIEADFIVANFKVDNPATEAISFEATLVSTGAVTVTESP